MSGETISFWNKTVKKTQYPQPPKDLETDILIIGSGITGITCAYCLALNGARPIVIEAGGLCDGTTGNTTGKVTIQHDIIYSNLLKKHGRDFAQGYADSQTEALNFVRRQVKELSIDCQLADTTSYIYAQTREEKDQVKAEYEIARDLGIDAEFTEIPGFPPGNMGMLGFRDQAAFHPVRYVNALAAAAAENGAIIYCDTKAVKLQKEDDAIRIFCEKDIEIRTKHLVMATQYPFYDGPNLFFTRLYAKRSYGIAVSTANDWPEGNFINVGEPSRSIRTHVENGKKVLIVVGEGHPTGRGAQDTQLHYEALVQFADQIAGAKEVLAKWSAQDYDTPDQLPYIGRISDNSNIYVASGFGKWGLTNGTLAGNMISELILNGNCRYEEIYSRKRKDYSSSIGKTISAVLTPVGELIKSKLEFPESCSDLKQGEGRSINFEGQKAGIYRDFDDTVTILDISCTHMSTELNFNSAEKSWDCPAHGGRYSVEGKLLEGPPKDSLKVLFQGKFSELAIK
ncbi:tRNA 5-methylaminomethyl-2-thiouridine biosynthesis bifunctional protein MnmC [bioreactor metagenome]|uniref:tRNA 5-methylaminomethyl-2-thiouridine biosynthesis bifunctional protein MnmC n=1 Tax=bioreactor metagenome TaxID=1076179 RepID=A0A644VVD0_9ZZZZ